MHPPSILAGRDRCEVSARQALTSGPGKKVTPVRWKRGRLARKEPFFSGFYSLIMCNEDTNCPHVRELLRTRPREDCQILRWMPEEALWVKAICLNWKAEWWLENYTVNFIYFSYLCKAMHWLNEGALYVVCIEIHSSWPSRALKPCSALWGRAHRSIFIFHSMLHLK